MIHRLQPFLILKLIFLLCCPNTFACGVRYFSDREHHQSISSYIMFNSFMILSYSANQWTGFYMIGTSSMKELKLFTENIWFINTYNALTH